MPAKDDDAADADFGRWQAYCPLFTEGTDGRNEHIRRYELAAELVHFRTEGLDLLGYLLLFIFVSAGHFEKTVMRLLHIQEKLDIEQRNCEKFLYLGAVADNIYFWIIKLTLLK